MNKKRKIAGPVLILENDKKAVEFVLRYFQSGECCSVISVADIGKELVYNDVLERIKTLYPPYAIETLHASWEEELQPFLDKINCISGPLVCFIDLSIVGKDVSWFIDEIDKIRIKRRYNFVPVIFSVFQTVYRALTSLSRVLTSNTYMLRPITWDDTLTLLSDWEKRFGYTITTKQKQEIYQWSTGYIGILKALFLLLRANKNFHFTLENILQEEIVIFRLQSLIDGFPEDALYLLLNKEKLVQQALLFDKVGLTKNGQLFNSLLITYIQSKIKKSSQKTNYSLLFSDLELPVFEYLIAHPEQIISREDIAKIMWDDAWEEKFSNWAIDQMIHRIREKLIENKLPYQVETKKGKGFYLLSL